MKTMNNENQKMRELTESQLLFLARLIGYSNRYQISVQFWPDQTAVYIFKDGVEMQAFGGDFDHAVGSSNAYLDRITGFRGFTQ